MYNFKFSDSHVHMGFYTKNDLLISPIELAQYMNNLKVSKFLVCSNSMLSKNYKFVNNEMKTLIDIIPDKVMPLFWARPFMFDRFCNIYKYYDYPIYGFKIHGHHDAWEVNGKRINRLFSIANEMSLPILAHTGYKEAGPEAISLKKMAEKYPDVKLVLAHGRPEDQTLYMVENFPNVYVDTAYTSDDCIFTISEKCDVSKIIFGTDFPIDKLYYPNENIEELYHRKIEKLVVKYGLEIFAKWSQNNFNFVFNPDRYDA